MDKPLDGFRYQVADGHPGGDASAYLRSRDPDAVRFDGVGQQASDGFIAHASAKGTEIGGLPAGATQGHHPAGEDQLFGAVPRGQLRERVGTDQPDQFCVLGEFATEVRDRIEGETGAPALNLRVADLKHGVSLYRHPCHLQSNSRIWQRIIEFVRRIQGRNQDHAIRAQLLGRRTRTDQMSVMDRIEGAPEEDQSAGHVRCLIGTQPTVRLAQTETNREDPVRPDESVQSDCRRKSAEQGEQGNEYAEDQAEEESEWSGQRLSGHRRAQNGYQR